MQDDKSKPGDGGNGPVAGLLLRSNKNLDGIRKTPSIALANRYW